MYRIKTVKSVVIFLLLLFGAELTAEQGKWRMRARENFETFTISDKDFSYDYQSFSHTFNIWYEKPFDWAFGLATGPYVMAYAEKPGQKNRPAFLGQKVKLINHGLEYKRWLYHGLFVRPGVYYHQFNANAPDGKDIGYGGMIGLGYEFKISSIGLALEYSKRQLTLTHKKWDISADLIAIGLHFYSI